MSKIIKKPVKITSWTPEANAYRNLHRKKVDRLFKIKKDSASSKKKRKFDQLARQLWWKIIIKSNEM